MAWKTLKEATALTGVSRPTWYRRIEQGWPSRLEGERREVWVESAQLALLVQAVENLQQEVAALKRVSRPAVENAAKVIVREVTEEAKPPSRPRPKPELAGGLTFDNGPAFEQILSAAKRTQLADREIQRRAQLPEGWMRKARLGQKRTRASWDAWTRLETWASSIASM